MYPVLFDFGTIEIAGRAIPLVIGGYGLMFSLAVISGWLWFWVLGRGVNPKVPWTDIYFLMIIVGFVGAKLTNALLFLPDILSGHRTFVSAFMGGGVWLGGVVTGLAAWAWAIRRHRVRVGLAANLLFVTVPFAHAIGRIGCLLGGCCYGTACDRAWAITYTDPVAHALNGTPLHVSLHPTPAYEAGLEFANFAICYAMWRLRAPDWAVMATWLGLYGVQRFALEFLRDDPRGGTGLLSPSQWIGLVLVGSAVVLWGAIARSRGQGPTARSLSRHV